MRMSLDEWLRPFLDGYRGIHFWHSDLFDLQTVTEPRLQFLCPAIGLCIFCCRVYNACAGCLCVCVVVCVRVCVRARVRAVWDLSLYSLFTCSSCDVNPEPSLYPLPSYHGSSSLAYITQWSNIYHWAWVEKAKRRELNGEEEKKNTKWG